MVLEDDPLDPPEIAGTHAAISGQPNTRLKPEFALTFGGAHMDVRGLVAFIGVEMEPE